MTDFRNKYSVLQDFFGHSQFRNGQEQIIDSILAGRDCLGVSAESDRPARAGDGSARLFPGPGAGV